jgi:poly-beta-1,6-N-acetyl-D-glucosamine synthase
MYALITPALNEEKHIEKTLKAVLSQTILPVKWVIISDGSTDRTDEIVKHYSDAHEFIQYLRLDRDKASTDFASKVHAFNKGYEKLKGMDYLYVGNVDADVSFDRGFFEDMLKEFENNARLGIAGGYIFEEDQGQLKSVPGNDIRLVSGQVQLFRKECYESIGGYLPISVGGEDTVANIMARMNGWDVSAFPNLKIIHSKIGSVARGFVKESFRDGAKDYAIGSHPFFQILKSLKRMRQKPYILAAIIRTIGYFWQYGRRQERPVNNEFIKCIRREQFRRLQALLPKKA